MSEENKTNNDIDTTDPSESDIKKNNSPFSGLNLEKLLNYIFLIIILNLMILKI